jgi:hypothetical protein
MRERQKPTPDQLAEIKAKTDDELKAALMRWADTRFLLEHGTELERRQLEAVEAAELSELDGLRKDSINPAVHRVIDAKMADELQRRHGDPKALSFDELRAIVRGRSDCNLSSYEFREELFGREGLRRVLRERGMPKIWVASRLADVAPRRGQAAAHKVLSGFDGRDKGLYLHGNAGAGKSYLAASLIGSLARDDKGIHGPGHFIRWRALLVVERQKIGREEVERDWYGAAREEHLIVLDDFGAGSCTDWTMEIAEEILDCRTCEALPTIITSNLTPAQLHDKWGARVSSRVSGLCDPLEVKSSDWRRS